MYHVEVCLYNLCRYVMLSTYILFFHIGAHIRM